MRRILLLTFIAAIAPQAATAHVVRHNSIPEAFRGTWMPGTAACSADAKTAIVLTAKDYVGPAGNCSVDYVSETATPKGPLYSARLLCPSADAQARKKVVNLIFRSDTGGGISAGATFADLKPLRRCSESESAKK